MLTAIASTEVAYPSLVHMFSIGKSYEGRDIWAAKVSNNVLVDEMKPEVLFDALTHTDERLGVEQALYVLQMLTAGYASDPAVRRLVDERTIWIIFAVNPDGWAYDISGDGYHSWRKNRQPNGDYNPGTDLNRNYGYKWGCCQGDSSGEPYDWNYRGSATTPPATETKSTGCTRHTASSPSLSNSIQTRVLEQPASTPPIRSLPDRPHETAGRCST